MDAGEVDPGEKRTGHSRSGAQHRQRQGDRGGVGGICGLKWRLGDRIAGLEPSKARASRCIFPSLLSFSLH